MYMPPLDKTSKAFQEYIMVMEPTDKAFTVTRKAWWRDLKVYDAAQQSAWLQYKAAYKKENKDD
jgi:hypothetical protein